MKDKTNRKNKKRVVITVIIGVVIAVVVAMGLFLGSDKQQESSDNNGNKETKNGLQILEHDDKEGKVPEDFTAAIEMVEDFVEPGKDTLDISKISGFVSSDKYQDNLSNHEKVTDEEKNDKTLSENQSTASKIILSDDNLAVNSIGGYTGTYVEDGSNASVKNVAALLVTNKSDKMLQIGDITFQVNKKETAKFRITNLLPGTSVMVLEANKREYRTDDDYSYGKVANAYLDETSLMEDKFEIIKEDGKLILKNKTNEDYKKVYVYYKYVQLGGAYMGGITYRVPFENIKAKEEVDSPANHFNVNTSRIVDVQIAER